MSLRNGTMLGQYRIEKMLGSGGFGITYVAFDTKENKQVVIKENLPTGIAVREENSNSLRIHGKQEDFAWAMNNFINEARMLSNLSHPGIVEVYRAFEANGTAYFVMKYVEGQSLDIDASERKWGEIELRDMLLSILDALDYLHSQKLLHRDIKPSNIILSNDKKPVLIDFGAAKQMFAEHSQTVIESVGYTPLEQMSTRGKTGPWSDIYALASTAYKLMTSEKPPRSIDRIADDTFIPLSKREDMRHYSHPLRASIDKALKVNSKDRWQSSKDHWRQ